MNSIVRPSPVYVGGLAFTSASVRRCVAAGAISVARAAGAGAAASPPSPASLDPLASLPALVPLLAAPRETARPFSAPVCLAQRCARLSTCRKGSAVPSQASSRGLKQARQKAASHADNTRCLCHKHGVDNENQETQTARTRQPGEDRPLPGTGGHACARVARSAGDVPGKAPGSSACCNARAALVCDAHSSRAVQSTTCACRQHCCCRHSITTLPARGPPERLAPAVKVALQC